MNVASNTAGAPLSSAVFVAATRSAPAWCGRSIKTPPGYRARAASPTWRPWSKRSCSTLSGCSSTAPGSCTSHQSFLWHCRPEVKRDLERRAPVVMMRTLASGCDRKPGESPAPALPSTPPGSYCSANRDGRWSVRGTMTSGTRREWLRMMAALSGAVLVDGLLPRGLARVATGRVAQQQDPLAAFRARIGAVPIQAQPLAENLTLLSGPGGNVVVLRGADGLVMVDTFVSPAWPRLQESLKGLGGPVKFVINT